MHNPTPTTPQSLPLLCTIRVKFNVTQYIDVSGHSGSVIGFTQLNYAYNNISVSVSILLAGYRCR